MMFLSTLLLLALITPSPDPILERMRIAQADLETLKARIEQVKTYPQLGIDDPVEKGFLYFQPGKMRLEIQEPEIRILVVKDGKYVLYQPRIKQAIFGKLEGQGTKGHFTGLLTGSAESFRELEESYSVSNLGEETLDGRSVHHLAFHAKPGVPVYCREIELFIDTALFLPVRQKCLETNQSEITMTLADIERNSPLEKGLFEVEIPEGVERIEQGRDE
jgi:outer membrane lipoprotein-sorting protein